MNTPKISVLIPLYNRKHYAEDCIDSVLNQTFKDFEIIIRDDVSTDGVFDFVKDRYSAEIAAGKIKLLHNEKNLGEVFNVSRLLRDATGKYLTILHNDDLYLPMTLEKLFYAAEKYSADVVHFTNFFTSPKDGVIGKGTRLKKISHDKHNVTATEIFSSDLNERFTEWVDGGTFQDLQYNIFRREFIKSNEIFYYNGCCESLLFTLIWILRAKVFVKIPDALYIRRDAPDSQTNDTNSELYKFERSIPLRLEGFRSIEKFISECDFINSNDELKYLVKTKIFLTHENLIGAEKITRGNKSFVELYGTIENAFRKYFGADAVYLAVLFHWAHLMQFNKGTLQNMLQECLKIINRDI